MTLRATRVALITGAAQGIGYAIAQRLGRAGVAIAIVDANLSQANAAVDRLASAGVEARAYGCDVTNEAQVASTVDAAAREFGRLDIVVNNAGIIDLVDGAPVPTESLPTDTWQRTLAVNLTGPFFVCRAAIPWLKRSPAGRIVNIASRAARMRAGTPAYSASKSGLVALSRVMAGELGAHGITVNCVAPSRVSTPLTVTISSPELIAKKLAETPLGRLAEPEDVAGAVAYLVSEEARFVTGAILDVNGGSFMP